MLLENVCNWDHQRESHHLKEPPSEWTVVRHVSCKVAKHITPPAGGLLCAYLPFSFFHFSLNVVDGLQVQYFSNSTACTGTVTTMVYPVGSSTGGNCYPLQNTYLSQALQLYNIGLGSFKPMCMFITASNPSIPGIQKFMCILNHFTELPSI